MKHITAMILALAMLCAVSCKVNTTTPAETTATTTTVGSDAPIAPPETTETIAPAEEPFDAAAFLADCTVYEVTTDTATDPLDELDKLADAEKPEKIAVRFTDLDGFTIFVNMWTKDRSLYPEISHMIYGNNVIECPEPIQYSLRSFSVIVSGEVIALPGNYQTNTYFLSKDGYINLPTVRDEGNSGSKLDVFVYEDKIICNYINTLFSDVVSLGGELRDDYNSDDDLYAEYGKIVLNNGVPQLEMTDRETIGEWYQSDDFPYAKIRDKYGFKTLRDMAKRFKSTEEYQEFIEIYEELEGN